MDALIKEEKKDSTLFKKKDKKAKLTLGKALWSKGYRYRKSNKGIVGNPDFTFRKDKVAIFCCKTFHNDINLGVKMESSYLTDADIDKDLKKQGWKVFWFSKNKINEDIDSCIKKIESAFLKKTKRAEVNLSERTSINYSEVRKILQLDTRRPKVDEGLAAVTHFLQNRGNKLQEHYKNNANVYLKEKDLLEEPPFQYELPIKYDVPFPPPKTPQFNFIDLFAGIGGFRMAFQNLGGKCVFTSEWNKFSQKTYEANYGEIPFGDITKVNENLIPDHDLLLGGFPCQPFSIAGVSKKKSLGREHGFKDETQGTLFFDIVRILEAKRPKAFLLENVKNLVSHDKKRTFKVIQGTLRELGYSLHCKVLDGKHFVPQHRERIFIVGFDKEVFNGKENFEFPELPEAKYIVKDILEQEVDKKYTLSDKLWEYLQNYAKKHKAKGNGFGFGMTKLDGITRTISARYYKDGAEILIPQEGKNPRRLTPRECARIQGYPENFIIPVSDNQAYQQFGNSVVMPLIQFLGAEIIKTLIE